MSKTEMTTPICDFLRDYAASGISRFHMPGHKGHNPADLSPSYVHDIPEVSGADSLYEAGGIIRESEENASRLFGTAATYYSTEGSSHCIRTMLALATDFGKNPLILATRNVHRAFISAAALLDLDIQWLMSEDKTYTQCSCSVSANQVKTVLSGMDVLPAAVYLTSPDYLGNLADIAAIAEMVHSFGLPLLIDNAHGAYLHFLEKPIHPMDLGADMCCDSAHKTLPALTGCAYLHISRGYTDRFGNTGCISMSAATVRRTLSLFGSSSPSYLLMESLDQANAVLDTSWRKQLSICISLTDSCKASLQEMGWHIMGEPLKITIKASSSGFCGQDLADVLRKNGIECEYADPDYVVLMVSPYNTREDFGRLLDAMKSIAVQISTADGALAASKDTEHTTLTLPLPEKVLSIREAAFSKFVSVPAEESAGRICGDLTVSCPPAVPIVVCGERIPKEAVDVFRNYGITHIDVIAEQ